MRLISNRQIIKLNKPNTVRELLFQKLNASVMIDMTGSDLQDEVYKRYLLVLLTNYFDRE